MAFPGAGIPYVPSFGHVGETLRQLAPQILAEYLHVAWEAVNNASRKARTTQVLSDPTTRLVRAMGQEFMQRELARPAQPAPSPEAPQRWGTLGDLVFDLLTAPSSMSVTDGVTYARHNLVGGKPRLQFTGQDLQVVHLGIHWHFLVHPDIEGGIKALLAAMRDRQVLDLVIGDEASSGIYAGSYVIEKIPHQVTKHLPNGRIADVDLTLELVEWADDPELVLAPPAPALRKKKVTTPATSAQSKVDPKTGLIGAP